MRSIPHSADSSGPLLFTPTSLLPNHALIIDIQQITGSNEQQWIKCTAGRDRSVAIYFAVNSAIISASLNTAAISPGRGLSNGLYCCRAGGSQYYVSLFFNTISDSSKTTPTYVQLYHTINCI